MIWVFKTYYDSEDVEIDINGLTLYVNVTAEADESDDGYFNLDESSINASWYDDQDNSVEETPEMRRALEKWLNDHNDEFRPAEEED